MQDEKAIENTFSKNIDVTHSLDLKIKNIGLENTPSKIVKIFRIFDNIKKIKKSQQTAANSSFSFKIISEEEVKNAIKGLPINKSTISGDIPTKVLKQYSQIYSKKLADVLNESVKMDKFSDILKKAEVTLAHKKDNMNDQQNSCLVSTLSNLSKVFQELTYSQTNTYMSDKFSNI